MTRRNYTSTAVVYTGPVCPFYCPKVFDAKMDMDWLRWWAELYRMEPNEISAMARQLDGLSHTKWDDIYHKLMKLRTTAAFRHDAPERSDPAPLPSQSRNETPLASALREQLAPRRRGVPAGAQRAVRARPPAFSPGPPAFDEVPLPQDPWG